MLFQVVRYEPKDFSQRRPDGRGGFIWNINGVRRVLYRLRTVLDSGSDVWIFVVEGEKDADRLVLLGLVATTNSGGAGKWSLTDSSPLHGRRICIIADNDPAGQAHAREVAACLRGKAAEIRILALPGLAPKGDISDWLDAGHTISELTDLVTMVTSLSSPPTEEKTGTASHRAVIVRASKVIPRKLLWLWRHRIPLGKTTSISGAPDMGKSMLGLYMAARVSAGQPWPDLPDEPNPAGGVVIVSAEDDSEDTIVPRLIAARADRDRVNILEGTELTGDDGSPVERVFTLEQLGPLEDAIRRTEECRLVIIDPAPAYLGSADSHRNAEVRAVLAPLAKMASRLGVAIVMTNHFSKGGTGPAINRTMGSLAFVAAPRAAWVCVPDRSDPTLRLFLRQKLNIANQPPGLAYRIVPSEADSEIPVISWEAGPVTITADEALAEEPKPPRAARVAEAVGWLSDLLSNGPLPEAAIEAAAEKGGLKWRTVQRAKSRIKVVSRKHASGWEWSLPEPVASETGGEERHSVQSGDVGGLGGVGTLEVTAVGNPI